VCMFILWIYLPHMIENMALLCFWSWLTSLNVMSSNYIPVPSNHMSLFPMVHTPLCVCVHFDHWFPDH
jgi:hypothetical protein